jgi:peptide deformylase
LEVKERMSVRPILQLGHPHLLQSCAPVSDPRLPAVLQLITDLADTLADFRQSHGYGRGIAAPQIGELVRVIYLRMQPSGFAGPLINPVITHASSERMELWDDCFSFPDLLVKVQRHRTITVAYRDGEGMPQTLDAEGALSELLQHEIDHLDGVLAIHRALGPEAFATREEWQRRYRSPLS